MRLNELAPAAGSVKARKRVGRGIGSGLGKTSGRGHKGQKSRSGGKLAAGFEGGQMPLHMRLPKFGFTSRVGRVTAQVRTGALNKMEADVIDIAALRRANLIRADIKRVKVMLAGEVTKKLTLKGVAVSKGARAAIEGAGGKIEEAPPPSAGRLTAKPAEKDADTDNPSGRPKRKHKRKREADKA